MKAKQISMRLAASLLLVMITASMGWPKEPKEEEEGLSFTSSDGGLSARIGGRVTTHFFAFQQGSLQNSDIFISRARLFLEGKIFQKIQFKLENDFTSASGLRDAYLNIAAWPSVRMQIGQFKVPFSMESLYSHRYIDLVERPAVVTGTVNPSRDIGVMVHGKVYHTVIQYQFALMNGSGQNTGDKNKDKDICGRIVFSPFSWSDIPWLTHVSLGGAITYGNEPFSTTTSISGQTPAGFSFYKPVPVKGTRQRVNGQFSWFVGPASLKGEYIRTREARENVIVNAVGKLGDFVTEGWYAAAAWVITGEKDTPGKLRPSSPLFPEGGPGAWKAVTRYEEFTLDVTNAHAPSEPPPHGFRAWSFGITWYPVSDLRVSADYQKQIFSDPARSPRPGHRNQDVLMGRVQVEF